MKVMHRLASMLCVVMIVVAVSLPGQAQVVSVTVQGRVYDASGAPEPWNARTSSVSWAASRTTLQPWPTILLLLRLSCRPC